MRQVVSEQVLLILTSLADRPRHGYALLQEIEALSGGRVRLSTGTLYGALRRLLEEGWIERSEQEDTSRDKQAYRLTPAGRKELERELDRMKQLTRAVSGRLRRAYRFFLGLYPRDYRAWFAAEMLAIFDARAAEGGQAWREVAGAAAGAVREWVAKAFTDPEQRARGLPDLRLMRPAGVARETWFARECVEAWRSLRCSQDISRRA